MVERKYTFRLEYSVLRNSQFIKNKVRLDHKYLT